MRKVIIAKAGCLSSMAIIIPKRPGFVPPTQEQPQDTPGEVTPRMAKLGIAPRGAQPKPPTPKKVPKFIEDRTVWEPPPSKETGIILDIEQLLEDHPPPPTPTGAPFLPYGWQKEDITTLSQWDRVGVFLPVGAGKTFIATYLSLAYGDDYRIILVLPVLIRQWVKWLNAIPGAGSAIAYRGTKKQRAAIELPKHKWWVMSYGIFKNDFHKLLKLVEQPASSVTLVVDEAHSIKNVESWLHKRVSRFSVGQRLVLMTGTELNSPMDSYAYIALKTPTVYRSIGQFERLHVKEKDEYSGTVKEWQELEMMNRNLYLQSVRRDKKDVHAHVPTAHYFPVEYDLDPEHQALYNKLVEEQLLELENGGKIDATTASALYNKSQQCVTDWDGFAGSKGHRPAILDVIDGVVDEIDLGQPGASKFIIWTWFRSTTRTVAAYMEEKFPGQVAIAFSESDSEKETTRFMEDPSCIVLVAQPGSAGAGLNPQYVCWECLFVEVPTRTIPFTQAAGRIDREGQAYNANIRIATAANTIQVGLFQNLLENDKLVQKVQGSMKSLRDLVYGVERG